MKRLIVASFFLLTIHQVCPAQSVPLDIMATAVSQPSMDSVPLKVSVPRGMRSSELIFPVSEEESGVLFITGTPYDSLHIQVPDAITVLNQYDEGGELKNFQLKYGSSKNMSAMEAVSPAGCVSLQVPETGRIHIRLGGRLVSDEKLRGIYTGSIRLNCKREE